MVDLAKSPSGSRSTRSLQSKIATVMLVTCKEDLTFWYFTKPNHPADPGVIQRTIVQENGTWNAQERGYSFASDAAQPAFKTWLAQIADLDRQMKNYIEKQHGKMP